jgi:hypothetical protein
MMCSSCVVGSGQPIRHGHAARADANLVREYYPKFLIRYLPTSPDRSDV